VIENIGLFAEDELPPPPAAPTGPHQSIYVHFEDVESIEAFARLVGQPLTTQTRRICYPADERFSAAWRTAFVPPPGEPEDDPDDDGDSEDEREDDGQPGFIDAQPNLFGMGEWWEEFWAGMPEFDQRDQAPFHSVVVDFARSDDVTRFSRLVGQTITPMARRTRSIWFPEAEIGRFANKRYRSSTPIGPRHPVYIVSKGRWETRLTSDHLYRLDVPHYVVVEEQERERYASRVRPSATLLVLDRGYQRDYDPCDELGDSKGKGPGPARNFAWEHAISSGARWHWVMDDNIDGFFRLNRNLKTPIADGTIFRVMENFVERWENVGMAGPNYFMFASRKTRMPPFVTNTRIYSCNLIRNDLPYRWRGRYNEDTDLSLRMLKDGLATVQFNAFLQFKVTTQTLGGGNTAEFYAKEGTRPKSEMQVKLHPDVSRLVWKWGRWHHHVDYRPFRKNRLVLKAGVEIPDGVDDHGMTLEVDPEPAVVATPPACRRAETVTLDNDYFDSWSSLPPPK